VGDRLAIIAEGRPLLLDRMRGGGREAALGEGAAEEAELVAADALTLPRRLTAIGGGGGGRRRCCKRK
jgi:hypothetical protein